MHQVGFITQIVRGAGQQNKIHPVVFIPSVLVINRPVNSTLHVKINVFNSSHSLHAAAGNYGHPRVVLP
jgi:hypothetical protein